MNNIANKKIYYSVRIVKVFNLQSKKTQSVVIIPRFFDLISLLIFAFAFAEKLYAHKFFYTNQ